MRGDPVELSGADRQGARERAFRILAGTVGALFLAFAGLGGGFLWYDNAVAWVDHTHQVRNGIDDVLQAVTDAESAQRAYVLTGDERFTETVLAARSRAQRQLGRVAALTEDNPAQQQRVVRLRVLMTQRLAVIDQIMALRRVGEVGDAAQMVLRGEGAAAMSGVRQLVRELDQEEARLETRRDQRIALVRGLVFTGLIFFAVLLTVLFLKAMRDLSQDREAEAETAERLRGLLADRTLLVDEVNHRVKNSLQQIASVVRLQSRSVGPEAREALEQTLARIMAVGRVHEQLYRSDQEVGAFDARDYAETLARELVGSMGRDDVVLETELESVQLHLRQAVPMALILNELITNALKYGCPEDRPCRIRVAFGTDGDEYRLRVSDDGVGLPEGFSLRENKSLGMRAIQALTRQLGGRFEVEHPEVGASFAVAFPRSDA